MQGFKIPKQLATGLFTDIVVPSIGQHNYGAIWNNTTKKIEWAQFEIFGSVTSGIAAHVALSNPHSQYPLSSSLGTAAYLNVGTSANNIVQLNGSGFLPALNGSLLTNLPATTPGGGSGYIQYNNAGAFGASGVYWDSVNSRAGLGTASPAYKLDINGSVNVATALIVPVVRPAADSTTAWKVTKADGATAVVTVDTTNDIVNTKNLYVNTTASSSKRYGVQVDLIQSVDNTVYGLLFQHIIRNNGLTSGFSSSYGVSGSTSLEALSANSYNRTLYGGAFQVAWNASSGFTASSLVGTTILAVAPGISGAGTITPGEIYGVRINNHGTNKVNNSWAVYVDAQSGSNTANYAIYTNAGDIRLMASNSDKIGFHGVTPVARQLLATGAGRTVDDVITFLQNLGLARQS